MKPITIHPLSAFVGAAVLAVPFALMSLQGTSATSWPNQAIPIPVSVQEMPDPHSFVQINEGVPFTVPAGKLLVCTALGDAHHALRQGRLLVDGVREVTAELYQGSQPDTQPTPSVQSLPPGFTVDTGAVVTVETDGGYGEGRAWGYLVDA